MVKRTFFFVDASPIPNGCSHAFACWMVMLSLVAFRDLITIWLVDR
jgi:hypothetical protein